MQGNGVIDLAIFDTKTQADRGFDLDILHIKTREPTGFQIRILGMDSAVMREHQREMQDLMVDAMRNETRKSLTNEEVEARSLQRLVVDDPGGTGAAAERKIGLGPGERGIERNRALGGGPGGFMLAQVPVQERQQIVGVGVVRVQADTFL